MEPVSTPNRYQQIVAELKKAMEHMSARLTFEVEPALTFALNEPRAAQPAERTEHAE
jgi:hypothetical protein